MFRIEPAPFVGVDGSTEYVVDEERDTWLQRVSGLGPEPGEALQLHWGSRTIPFEIDWRGEDDAILGYKIGVARFLSFGTSMTAKIQAGISPYRFTSDTELHDAMLLATEALLVFGRTYNGLDKPDGYYQVELDSGSGPRRYKLSDFNYPA